MCFGRLQRFLNDCYAELKVARRGLCQELAVAFCSKSPESSTVSGEIQVQTPETTFMPYSMVCVPNKLMFLRC